MEIILIGIVVLLIAIYFELKRINSYVSKVWSSSENIHKPMEQVSNSVNNLNRSEELLKFIAAMCYERTMYDSAYYTYGKSWHSLEADERKGVSDATFHDIAKSMQRVTPDFLDRVMHYEN